MNLIKRLEKSLDFWFLLFASFFFFLLRLPSLFEPYWYGDEGIYQVIGLALRQGRLLYAGIWDNKPPLLYVLYGLLGSEQDLIRAASLVAGVAAIVTFFLLAKKLFREKSHHKAIYMSTALFALLLGAPLLEGNVANAENFMLFPILAGGLLTFMAVETKVVRKSTKLFFAAGLLFSIAFLFKIVAVFDFAAFVVFLLVLRTPSLAALRKEKFIEDNLKYFAPIIFGFFLPIFLTFAYFLLNGAFGLFLKATFFSNIGYVSYANTFFIPQGLLLLKLAVLGTLVYIIYRKKSSLPHHLIFILVWLMFSLFNAMFSQRPYTHYLLVLIPSFSLLIGALVYEVGQRARALMFVLLSLFIISMNFSLGVKSIAYYKNYLDFVTGGKNVDQYRNFFDRNTPLDYQLGDFLKTHTLPSDHIFIWGNNAQVYKIVNKIPPGRYIVAYHIQSYKDGLENTKDAILKNPPKYIVIMPNVPRFPLDLSNYVERMKIGKILIYEKNI